MRFQLHSKGVNHSFVSVFEITDYQFELYQIQ